MNDFGLLVLRSLRNALRQPWIILFTLAMGVLFLVVYKAGLSGVAELPGFRGDYLGFVLPAAIASAAVVSAGFAGQASIQDIHTGYFTKLLATPSRRLALIWGPMVAGAVLLVAQVALMLILARIMGLKPATGIWGALAVIGYAFVLGMAFAGFVVWVAVRTGSSTATQAATLALFLLVFLSIAFLPAEFITAGWPRTAAATINPLSYVLEAMRTLLLEGWRSRPLLLGLLVVFGLATLTGALALWRVRRSSRLTAR